MPLPSLPSFRSKSSPAGAAPSAQPQPPVPQARSATVGARAAGRLRAQDHECLGYPLDVYLGAASVDVGSVVAPLIVGGYALHFGRGHPLNAVGSLLPSDALYLSSTSSSTPPTLGRVARRAELLAAVEALLALRDAYGERGARAACAHVHTDSKYVAKVWGEWLPRWEAHGWPGEGSEGASPEELSPKDSGLALDGGANSGTRSKRASVALSAHGSVRSAHGSVRSRSYSRGTSSRLASDAQSIKSDVSLSSDAPYLFARSGAPHDEDLMRQLAKLRAHFGMLQSAECGGCFFYEASRRASPAHENARAAATARGQEALDAEQQSRRAPSRSASRAASRASSGKRASTTTVARHAPTLPPLMLGVPEDEATQETTAAEAASAEEATPAATAPAVETVAPNEPRDASPASSAADTASVYDDDDDAAPAPAAAVAAPVSTRSGPAASGVGGARSSRRIYGAPSNDYDAASKRLSSYSVGEGASRSARVRASAPAPARQPSLLDAVHVPRKNEAKGEKSTRYMPAMASDAYRRDANLPRDKSRMKWWERAGYWLAA